MLGVADVHAGALFAMSCLCQNLFELKNELRQGPAQPGLQAWDTGIPRSPLLALDDAFYKAHSALSIQGCVVKVSLHSELIKTA